LQRILAWGKLKLIKGTKFRQMGIYLKNLLFKLDARREIEGYENKVKCEVYSAF